LTTLACIIPTLGVRPQIFETISSVTSDASEIIVVVNGEIYDREILNRLGNLDGVKLLKNSKASTTDARQIGIDQASSEWISFCDDDDLWIGGRVKLLNLSNVELITGRSKWIFASGKSTIYPQLRRKKNDTLVKHMFRTSLLGKANIFSPNAAIIKRSYLLRVPWQSGTPLKDGHTFEDIQWAARASSTGIRWYDSSRLICIANRGTLNSITEQKKSQNYIEHCHEVISLLNGLGFSNEARKFYCHSVMPFTDRLEVNMLLKSIPYPSDLIFGSIRRLKKKQLKTHNI
jgi:glycosyltransferase involved in cell wall biosynthesis